MRISFWILFAYVLYRAGRLANRRERIIFLGRAVLSVLISLAMTALIAYFYWRARPFAALGFDPLIFKSALDKSFPSDHAVTASSLATILFLYHKNSGYWGIAAAVLIGLGRVLAGVHYVSDVLAGAGLGVLAALIVFKISANASGRIHDGR